MRQWRYFIYFNDGTIYDFYASSPLDAYIMAVAERLHEARDKGELNYISNGKGQKYTVCGSLKDLETYKKFH